MPLCFLPIFLFVSFCLSSPSLSLLCLAPFLCCCLSHKLYGAAGSFLCCNLPNKASAAADSCECRIVFFLSSFSYLSVFPLHLFLCSVLLPFSAVVYHINSTKPPMTILSPYLSFFVSFCLSSIALSLFSLTSFLCCNLPNKASAAADDYEYCFALFLYSFSYLSVFPLHLFLRFVLLAFSAVSFHTKSQ
jgi:hypothetical protein